MRPRIERIVSGLGRSPLAFSLAALLVVYHLFNLIQGEWFHVEGRWREASLAVSAGGRELASVESRRRDLPASYEPVDGASRAWRDLGFRVGYAVGRVPEFLFLGTHEPYQRIYLREEVPFQYPVTAGWVREALVPHLKRVAAHLEGTGVHFVIVPVPTKISIERGRVPTPLPADQTWKPARAPASVRSGTEDAYEVYRTVVDAVPGRTVDLFEAFSLYRERHKGAELFVPADSHWSSLGIAVAADAVMKKLRGEGWRLPDFQLEKLRDRRPYYFHDLLAPLQLPIGFLRSSPGFQWHEPLYRLVPEVPQYQGKLLLAGTCYSDRLRPLGLSLGKVLAKALHRTLVDASFRNTDALGPLRRIHSEGWLLEPGDLLVWEFALRLMADPDEPTPLPHLSPAALARAKR